MLATERVFRHNAQVGTMVGVAIVGALFGAARRLTGSPALLLIGANRPFTN
jgi:hypothetical protein